MQLCPRAPASRLCHDGAWRVGLCKHAHKRSCGSAVPSRLETLDTAMQSAASAPSHHQTNRTARNSPVGKAQNVRSSAQVYKPGAAGMSPPCPERWISQIPLRRKMHRLAGSPNTPPDSRLQQVANTMPLAGKPARPDGRMTSGAIHRRKPACTICIEDPVQPCSLIVTTPAKSEGVRDGVAQCHA